MTGGEFLAGMAGVIVCAGYVPYARNILSGKVRPARSARLMFALLLIIAIFQQRSLGAGLTLAVSIGEALGTLGILLLSLKRGVGGLRRLDLICYGLLTLDVLVWVMTGNALLALHLSILADIIAFFPTVHKTWVNPRSETAFFFAVGAVAPLLNLVAAGHLTYQIALYPVALAVENLVEVGLIFRRLPARVA